MMVLQIFVLLVIHNFQAQQDISPVVMTVISSLVLILQHAKVIALLQLVMRLCAGICHIDNFVICYQQELNKSLTENATITLGRFAWACPDLVAPHMEHFMQPWCSALAM